MVAIVLSQSTDNDYSKLVTLHQSSKTNGFGQMYYMPRIRLIVTEGVCDYFVWKINHATRFLVLPAFHQLINELSDITKASIAKIKITNKPLNTLNQKTCYVKIPTDLNQEIPAQNT